MRIATRIINILFILCLGLTVFFVVSHIRRTEYFENPSKQFSEEVYSGQTRISMNMDSYDSKDYRLSLSLNKISANIFISNINLQLTEISVGDAHLLDLIKVRPYSGMDPGETPEFKIFSDVPLELRKLNSSNNPYFAYDFIFKNNEKIQPDKFLVKLNIFFSENGRDKNINKEFEIDRKSKNEIKPLDVHSDVSFLFIPLFGALALLLFVIRLAIMATMIMLRRRKGEE